MECRDVRRLADAYLSGQLLVETAHAIGAHLDTCPACRAEVDGLRRLRAGVQSAVRGATDVPMRPEFAAAMRERLRTMAGQPEPAAAPAVAPLTPPPPELAQPAEPVASPVPASRTARRSWLALAAAAVLAVGVERGVHQWGARAWTSLLMTVAGDHQNCALTFALGEEPIPLEDAGIRFGGASRALAGVPLPTATASGQPLVVVERHSCAFGGERFVHLVLRYKGETVSVLVTDDPRPRLASIGRGADGTLGDVRTEGAFTLTSFTSGRHAAFVVSALAAPDLRDVASSLSAAITPALAGA